MPEIGAGPLRRLVEAMPKAELHLHLDGSVRVETALELARTRGVDAPTTYGGMCDALVAPERTASQAELLERFDLPIALLQDAEALERVDRRAGRGEGRRPGPLRRDPLGAGAPHARGLPLADGIAAVCRGAAEAAERTGIVVRLICTALRSHDPALNVELAETAARFRVPGLVGWDLAGAGGATIPTRSSSPGRSTPPGPAACGSPSMPASGAARPRSAGRWRSTRSGSPTGPARSTTRRSWPS